MHDFSLKKTRAIEELNTFVRRRRSLYFRFFVYLVRFTCIFGMLFSLIPILFIAGGGQIFYKKEISALTKMITSAEDLKEYTVLVAGKDIERTVSRSDTLMIAFVNAHEKKVSVISVPRDTRVFMNDNPVKINSAFSKGGIDKTRQIIDDYLGTSIDKYICVDIEGFVKCIDIIGGVEIDVEMDMNYTDKAQGLYIDLKKGKQILKGDTAMQYVRFREKLYGDLGRIQRQQKFLNALARKMKEFSTMWKIPSMLSEIYRHIDTDFTISELLMLASRFRGFQKSDVKFYTIPGAPGYVDKISYYLADPVKFAGLIKEISGITPTPHRYFEEFKLNGRGDLIYIRPFSGTTQEISAASVPVSPQEISQETPKEISEAVKDQNTENSSEPVNRSVQNVTLSEDTGETTGMPEITEPQKSTSESIENEYMVPVPDDSGEGTYEIQIDEINLEP